MTQLINQFELGKEKGQLDLRQSNNTISCRADSVLVPGQAVKLVDVAGGIPNVTAITADTDVVFGFATKSTRRDAIAIGDVIEISCTSNVMYMEAGAAIAVGAKVMPVVSGSKVITAAGATKSVVGVALDKAAADTDLIRVYILGLGSESVLGYTGAVAFYAAATSGGGVTVLNTITYANGKVISHTQV